jgi:hypothetical protein
MNVIKDYLHCGKLEFVHTRPNIVNFVVYKINDISHKILPLFNSSPLIGIKRLDCEDFSKVVFMMENEKHLTQNGKKFIEIIKGKMNSKRKI